MKTFIALLLTCSVCCADDLSSQISNIQKLGTTDVALTSTYTLKKPNIDTTKTLSEAEQSVVEDSLKHQGRILIHSELKPIKNDYQNDFDRGTVEYTSKCHNYSFHKVIIPDGTTIIERNFAQRVAHTKSIEGKNLTFIDCNLVNVEPDPTWIMKGCNNCQIQRVVEKTEDVIDNGKSFKKLTISHRVETDGKFIEVEKNEEIYGVGDSLDLAILRYQ